MPNYKKTIRIGWSFSFWHTARGKIERVKDTKLFSQYLHRLKSIPRRYWVIGGIVLSLLVYSLLFFIPKKVEFSYAGETCIGQLVLFPGAQTTKSDAFEVKIKDEHKIGSFAYAATKVCAEPKEAPKNGSYTASTGLFGGWFAAKQFAIKVADPPKALASTVIGNTISAALPVRIQLTAADTIHEYSLAVAENKTDCKNEDTQLVCDVAPLKLSPGNAYDIALTRSFKGEEPTKIAEGGVETLLPIVMQEASLAEGKVIYDTTKEFTFSFDLPLKEASVKLVQKEGEGTKDVEVSTKTNTNTLTVSVPQDLARKANFVLTLNQVVAEKGNSLEGPFAINFSTSGGPKPTEVSVGNSGVPQSAKIIVTFDQPIKEDVDIAQFAKVAGIGGSVARQNETQLAFTIQGGLCQNFSLVLDKGMASAVNSELSEAWKFDSRTICGTTRVIGYSVQGRAIVAHYFGNGSSTILFTGGIHGEERSAQQTMQAFTDHLMNGSMKIPDNRQVVVVPNTNPDGIAANKRNNARNVNVDRNFPSSNWQADIDTASGRIPNGGGTAPGSEPEAKALINLTRQLRPRLSVSFHAQGRLVGANQVGISIDAGNTYARTVGYGTMYGTAEEVMGYPITGEYEDWMGEEMGIAAILIELPTRSGNYLSSQLSAISKMLSL